MHAIPKPPSNPNFPNDETGDDWLEKSKWRAIRQGALTFAIFGLVTCLLAWLPGSVDHPFLVAILGTAFAVSGAVVWWRTRGRDKP